jgi:hypothetical protein
MAFTDLTVEFQSVYKQKRAQVPESKRRRINRAPRPLSDQPSLGKEFIAEAYIIVSRLFFTTLYALALNRPDLL